MSVITTIAAGICAAALCTACCDMGGLAAASSGGAAGGTSGAAASGATTTTSTSTFPEAALLTVASASKGLTFEVRTSPAQPPARGTCDVELRILDAASGEPVDGLSVQVVPWMVSMGHGSPSKPKIAAKGEGRYVASGVSLYMAGRWELRTTVSGPAADQAAPSIDVD